MDRSSFSIDALTVSQDDADLVNFSEEDTEVRIDLDIEVSPCTATSQNLKIVWSMSTPTVIQQATLDAYEDTEHIIFPISAFTLD